MAQTTSFTAIFPFQAIDGHIQRKNPLALSEYTSLAVPSGATVNGILITWTGGASSWDASTNVMTVGYAGSGNSSNLSANSTVTQYPDTGTTTFGGATNLWGLTWTPSQAAAINTKFAAPAGATGYHDALQVTIYYTVPVTPGGKIRLGGGKLKLRGKISL